MALSQVLCKRKSLETAPPPGYVTSTALPGIVSVLDNPWRTDLRVGPTGAGPLLLLKYPLPTGFTVWVIRSTWVASREEVSCLISMRLVQAYGPFVRL